MTKVMLGADTQMHWKPEAASGDHSWKQGGSGTAQWFGYMTEDGAHTPDESEGYESLRYIGGADRNVDTFVKGPTDYTGTLRIDKLQEIALSSFAWGKLAQAGSPTSTHTVTESGTLPSLAFEDGQEAVSGSHLRRFYSGVKVDKLTLSCVEGEELVLELDYIAGSKTVDTSANTAVTAATDVPYQWDDFKLVISGGGIDGNVDTMKEFTFSLTNNLDAQHYLNGTRNIGEQVGGNRDYEFTAVIHATVGSAYDWYKKFFEAGSDINIDLQCFRTSGTDDFIVTMSGCRMMDCDQPIQPGGQMKQTWTIQPLSCSLIARTAAAGANNGSWPWYT